MRDRIAVSALRSALSAISNAEAISPPPAVAGAGSPHIAGAVAGLDAGEAQRRALSAAEVLSRQRSASACWQPVATNAAASPTARSTFAARRAFSSRLHRARPHKAVDLPKHREPNAPQRHESAFDGRYCITADMHGLI